jgi:hypothetical protein
VTILVYSFREASRAISYLQYNLALGALRSDRTSYTTKLTMQSYRSRFESSFNGDDRTTSRPSGNGDQAGLFQTLQASIDRESRQSHLGPITRDQTELGRSVPRCDTPKNSRDVERRTPSGETRRTTTPTGSASGGALVQNHGMGSLGSISPTFGTGPVGSLSTPPPRPY